MAKLCLRIVNLVAHARTHKALKKTVSRNIAIAVKHVNFKKIQSPLAAFSGFSPDKGVVAR